MEVTQGVAVYARAVRVQIVVAPCTILDKRIVRFTPPVQYPTVIVGRKRVALAQLCPLVLAQDHFRISLVRVGHLLGDGEVP